LLLKDEFTMSILQGLKEKVLNKKLKGGNEWKF
jgi:hypothetical protein